MSKTMRRAVGAAVAMAVLGWTSRAAATEPGAVVSQSLLSVPDPRVRALTPRLAAVLTEAAVHSETLRRLVALIGATDGVIYVDEGPCGQRLRACLLHVVTVAGPNRLLRILVDPRNSDRVLMRSLGHELQHAVEVLSDRTIRSNAAIQLFYRATCHLCGGQFETDAAVLAGKAVDDELQNSAAAARR